MLWIVITLYCLALILLSRAIRNRTSKILMWLVILLGSAAGPRVIDFLLIAIGLYDGVKDPLYSIGYGILASLLFVMTVVSILLWDKFGSRYIARERRPLE